MLTALCTHTLLRRLMFFKAMTDQKLIPHHQQQLYAWAFWGSDNLGNIWLCQAHLDLIKRIHIMITSKVWSDDKFHYNCKSICLSNVPLQMVNGFAFQGYECPFPLRNSHRIISLKLCWQWDHRSFIILERKKANVKQAHLRLLTEISSLIQKEVLPPVEVLSP